MNTPEELANIKDEAELSNLLHKELMEDFPSLDFPEPNFDNPLFDEILNGTDPLLAEIKPITIDAITEREFGGKGIFDALMESVHSHTKKYVEDELLTKDMIPKVVIAAIEASMSASIQFVLSKDAATLNALKAKYEAINTALQIENTKATIKQNLLQAVNEEAKFTNIKMDTYVKETQKKYISEQLEAARATTLDTRIDGTLVTGSAGKQKDLMNAQITSFKNNDYFKLAQLYGNSFLAMNSNDIGVQPPNQFTQAEIDAVLRQVRAETGLL